MRAWGIAAWAIFVAGWAAGVGAAGQPIVFDRRADLPPDEREFNRLYPGYRPGDGQISTVNPPLFSWLYYRPG